MIFDLRFANKRIVNQLCNLPFKIVIRESLNHKSVG
jgi:hypothetical protein